MKPPSKYKMAILIWLAVYPVINLIFLFLGETLQGFPLMVRTFVMTLILIPLMVFVLMPFLTKTFRSWLSK